MRTRGSSFAKSFNDARAASLHRVQYFEQLGNRAIYQDGWVAAAFHSVPWDFQGGARDFNKDRWELYNISDDYSEAHDLADKYPARLNDLKKLFDLEAKKNKVYPLIDGMSAAVQGMFRSSRPTLIGDRKEFVYYGDTPRIPTTVAPKLLGSHRIAASLEIVREPTGAPEYR